MIVVSFYTAHTPYVDYVTPFIRRLDKFGLKYKIYEIENRGSWELNCAMKPEVLDWALQDYPDENILYLDIDAKIMRELPIDSLNQEIPGIAKVRGQVASGTIYLPIGRAREELVCTWQGMQRVRGAEWDQKVLAEVISKTDIPYSLLKDVWIAIERSYKVKDPVILHTQASRTLKHGINKTRPHCKIT